MAESRAEAIDRERLLACASLMACDSMRAFRAEEPISPAYLLRQAGRIAEICGESLQSIREKEIEGLGASIVPEEAVVDVKALLALADDMDSEADTCRDGMVGVEPFDVKDYAALIRRAVGIRKEKAEGRD